jgi:hypothetical protein
VKFPLTTKLRPKVLQKETVLPPLVLEKRQRFWKEKKKEEVKSTGLLFIILLNISKCTKINLMKKKR